MEQNQTVSLPNQISKTLESLVVLGFTIISFTVLRNTPPVELTSPESAFTLSQIPIPTSLLSPPPITTLPTVSPPDLNKVNLSSALLQSIPPTEREPFKREIISLQQHTGIEVVFPNSSSSFATHYDCIPFNFDTGNNRQKYGPNVLEELRGKVLTLHVLKLMGSKITRIVICEGFSSVNPNDETAGVGGYYDGFSETVGMSYREGITAFIHEAIHATYPNSAKGTSIENEFSTHSFTDLSLTIHEAIFEILKNKYNANNQNPDWIKQLTLSDLIDAFNQFQAVFPRTKSYSHSALYSLNANGVKFRTAIEYSPPFSNNNESKASILATAHDTAARIGSTPGYELFLTDIYIKLIILSIPENKFTTDKVNGILEEIITKIKTTSPHLIEKERILVNKSAVYVQYLEKTIQLLLDAQNKNYNINPPLNNVLGLILFIQVINLVIQLPALLIATVNFVKDNLNH